MLVCDWDCCWQFTGTWKTALKKAFQLMNIVRIETQNSCLLRRLTCVQSASGTSP